MVGISLLHKQIVKSQHDTSLFCMSLANARELAASYASPTPTRRRHLTFQPTGRFSKYEEVIFHVLPPC